MLPLTFMKKSEKERDLIVNRYYDYLREKKRERKHIEKIENWCETYLNKIDSVDYSFEMVIKANPDTLKKIKLRIDEKLRKKDINKELEHLTPSGNRRCYIKDTLYEDMPESARNYLVDSLDVRVCPYCNRNYVYSSDGYRTCQLDHYYSKNRYPILAISFYNLIPVCASCNLHKKEEEFEFYPHDLNSIDEMLKFSFELNGPDYLKNRDDVKVILVESKPKYCKQIEKLGLAKLYQKHNDIVQEIIRKSQLNSDEYIHSLYEENKDIFESEMEVESMVYSNYLRDDEVSLRSLGKLTRDIVMELKEYKKFI
ncbi:hypothetical protein AALB16_00760 [Lachnospiraceae bacterium 62-35]